MIRGIVYIEKYGSLWLILKTSRFPNTQIGGRSSFKTKREAKVWANKLGYDVANDTIEKGENEK